MNKKSSFIQIAPVAAQARRGRLWPPWPAGGCPGAAWPLVAPRACRWPHRRGVAACGPPGLAGGRPGAAWLLVATRACWWPPVGPLGPMACGSGRTTFPSGTRLLRRGCWCCHRGIFLASEGATGSGGGGAKVLQAGGRGGAFGLCLRLGTCLPVPPCALSRRRSFPAGLPCAWRRFLAWPFGCAGAGAWLLCVVPIIPRSAVFCNRFLCGSLSPSH